MAFTANRVSCYVRKGLDALPDLHAREHVCAAEVDVVGLEDSNNSGAKSALWRFRRSFHEEKNVVIGHCLEAKLNHERTNQTRSTYLFQKRLHLILIRSSYFGLRSKV